MTFDQQLAIYLRDNHDALPDIVSQLYADLRALSDAQSKAAEEQREELKHIAENQERAQRRQWTVIALLAGLLTTILADVMARTLSPFLPNEPGVGFLFLIHHL